MDFYEKQLGYTSVDGKKLRRGFTTGSAAAAASKAALIMLMTGKAPEMIDIRLFSGKILKILVDECTLSSDRKTAVCTVKKYAGDDIDATNNAEISASVGFNSSDKINITGGEGVGRITRSGLQVRPGESAINPKPKELIINQIEEIMEDIFDDSFDQKGVDIIISVKDGEKIAQKTFNPRLGIEGGISILGTTGIVEPMSEDAFKRSLLEELNIKKADTLAFVFGNMGEASLRNYGISSDKICICSNFIGYMLREASLKGVKKVLIAGHIGKLVKLSGGIFNTHSHIADAKNEIISANLALLSAPLGLIEKVMESITAEESIEYINDLGYERVFDILAQKAADKATLHTYNEIEVEVMMFDLKSNFLSESEGAQAIIKELSV